MAEGNAPQRPKITYHVNYTKTRREAKAWDKKYGETHNRDGSLKTGKKDPKRAEIRARLKASKKSGGIGSDAKRRYSGEGSVDKLARRTLAGSAEKTKKTTETSKKSITDSQKKRPQSKAKSSIPDAQKRNRMDASSTMTDAQKRRAIRTVKSFMPDSQREKKYGSKSTMSDDQKKGQVRKVESKTTSSPTQSSEGGQTFKQAFAEAHKKYKAGKGPRDFTWTNPKDGKKRSYAAVTQAEVEKAHKAGKIDAPTLASFLGNKKPQDEKKKKKGKRGSLVNWLDKVLKGN